MDSARVIVPPTAGPAWNPYREGRRIVEEHYLKETGRPMTGKQWKRERKRLQREARKG